VVVLFVNNYKEASNMRTIFEEIVDVKAVGQEVNTRQLYEILPKAETEKLKPAQEMASRLC
jgi:hypothetical protein